MIVTGLLLDFGGTNRIALQMQQQFESDIHTWFSVESGQTHGRNKSRNSIVQVSHAGLCT